MRLFLICLLALLVVRTATADMLTTRSPDALCNNGEQATFRYIEGTSDNWLVYIQGGGVAPNADAYRNRQPFQKQPATGANYGEWYPIVNDFAGRGYHVVVIPYCTGDLHQGFHTHEIDGQTVYFHGRRIIEDIFDRFDGQFASAAKLVFAGYSAGSIALGFNADLIARYDDPYIIADSFWLDDESLKVRLGWTSGRWEAVTNFIYPNKPAHCQGAHWAHCFPSRAHFEAKGLTRVFPIWNMGDRYNANGDQQAVRRATHADIRHYGAGLSIDARRRQMKGFEDDNWGHVMTANDLYDQEIEGMSVKQLIHNWIDGVEPSFLLPD